MVGGFLPVGAVLDGKYRIERVLGQGGMAEVYEATHVRLRQVVAIKVLSPALAADHTNRMRFEREARAAAALRSHHVVNIHDVGLYGDLPYIVMDRLRGQDLGDRIVKGGPLPFADAALIAIQACSALKDAHAIGIVHRDLKPSNLFLVEGEGGTSVRVLDFGISKVGGESGLPHSGATGTGSLTGDHSVLGTPAYMSPEQTRQTKDVDRRTDIWALGCVLYAMVTARSPFQAESVPEIFVNIMTRPPDPVAAYRPDEPQAVIMDAVIACCLQKDRERRYGTAAELALALAPLADERAADVLRTLRRTSLEIPSRPTAQTEVGAQIPARPVFAITASSSHAPSGPYPQPPAAHLRSVPHPMARHSGSPSSRTPRSPQKKFPPALLVGGGVGAALLVVGGIWWALPSPQADVVDLKKLESACQRSDAAACRKLGAILPDGPEHATRVASLFAKACAGGDGEGCTEQAQLEDKKRGTERNATAIADLFVKACASGHASGCSSAMSFLLGGRGVKPDKVRLGALVKKGATWLKTACGSSDAIACRSLGLIAELGLMGGSPEHALAVGHYQSACAKNDAIACNNLAGLHALGLGGPKDGKKAAELFARACAGGVGAACSNVGALSVPYRVVSKLGVAGATVFRTYCDRELTAGCTVTGKPVLLSHGRAIDLVAGASAFRKGCDAGEPHACVNLSGLMLHGRGVDYDRKAAEVVLQKACDAGSTAACGELGALFASRIIEGRDEKKGLGLLKRACDGGETDACVSWASFVTSVDDGPNVAAGVRLLRDFCADDFSYACGVTANLLLAGIGSKKQPKQALKLLMDSCVSGYDTACAMVADYHSRGIGTKRDLGKAHEIWGEYCAQGNFDACVSMAWELGAKKATVGRANVLLTDLCEQRYGPACNALSYNRAVGRGFAKDLVKSAQLATVACELDYSPSCYDLAVMRLDGRGVSRDETAGRRLLAQTCDAGLKRACDRQTKLK